ncbi:AAA family ATPase [Flavobacterium sp. LB2P74]|uniref:AAA family ATPase n=1 Tax=Flavobacterium sp. LB2P74 TaxID=3401717 RepID=UPI003AAD1537
MITNIYIKNFKILNEVDITLSNLNLISGKNSVGKSSLMQVLLLLRQSFEKNTLLNSGLLLQGDYVKIGKGKDALTRDTLDEFIQFAITWEDESFLNLKFKYSANSDLQITKSIKPSSFKESDLNGKALFNSKFTYLSADRIGPQTTYPVSDYHINTLKSLGIRGEFTAHFLAENENSPIEHDILLHKKGTTNGLLNQVSAWMSEISSGIKIGTKVIEEINNVSLTYEFLTEDGYTDKFTPQNVGFGLTYVLPVVTALLSAKKGDIILIENPEAHLHPAGQSAMGKLISLVAQSGVQLFIETHSDHLLNGVRVLVSKKEISKENISLLYFSKDEELKKHHVQITTPYLDEKGRIDEWPKGFFDEWDNQLDELLED